MSTTAPPTELPSVVDGPGRVAPGQRVHCLHGSLPARDGRQGGGVLVSIGPKTSLVDVYGSGRRRIRNELLHPRAGHIIAAQQSRLGVPTTTPSGRQWLPGWSWLDWTVQQHVEFQRGERAVPSPPPPPQRLIIVACGSRKTPSITADAGDLYIGSYHRAARRAAAALATPGTRVMIVSALYGLLDLTDNVLSYDQRLGQPGAITAGFLREQAAQLGLTATADVIVLAPKGYADLLTQVWPHAQTPLRGSRGIGDHMARFAALAAGRSLTAPAATPAVADRTETRVASERETAAARAAAARIEAELGASVRSATSGRVAEPTVALLHAALSHEQQLAEQRGQRALAQVLAERVAGLQEAYDADRAERARQRAERHARIIAERAAAAPREIVIIPAGSRQLDHPAPAGEMYVGSYHQAKDLLPRRFRASARERACGAGRLATERPGAAVATDGRTSRTRARPAAHDNPRLRPGKSRASRRQPVRQQLGSTAYDSSTSSAQRDS